MAARAMPMHAHLFECRRRLSFLTVFFPWCIHRSKCCCSPESTKIGALRFVVRS